jgi:hypothetical protein
MVAPARAANFDGVESFVRIDDLIAVVCVSGEGDVSRINAFSPQWRIFHAEGSARGARHVAGRAGIRAKRLGFQRGRAKPAGCSSDHVEPIT